MTRMRILLGTAAVGFGLTFSPGMAAAKGCIKGAIVGGIAGHYTVRHGTLGALAGCIVGRHEAKRRALAHSQTRTVTRSPPMASSRAITTSRPTQYSRPMQPIQSHR
jgi:hypothetical protein